MKILEQGFSLFELLIAITVIFISSLFVFPYFKNFLTETREKIFLSQLVNAIHLTRNQAIIRHETLQLCAGNTNHYCTEEWSSEWVMTNHHQVLQSWNRFAISGTLFFRAFPKGRQGVEFSSMGFSKATNATFWFCRAQDPAPKWAVVINKVGRLRVVYPDENNRIENGEENRCQA